MNADFGSMQLEREFLFEQMGRVDDWAASVEQYGGFDAETREAFRADGLRGYWRVVQHRMAQHAEGSYSRAQVFARMGDKDRAFEDLAFAITKRDHLMTQLKVNPILDPLRSDPRFADLLQRMNLTP
jgi:hypothetical protein